MTNRTLYHMALSDAYLCLDCERISEQHDVCPACGSAGVTSVARFLNRHKECMEAETCNVLGDCTVCVGQKG